MARPTQVSKRTRRRFEVRYGPDQPERIGYSGNLSRTGMMIRAIRVFAPGTTLSLEIRLPQAVLRLRGLVIWARQGSVRWLPSGRIGMGIRFLDPPEETIRRLSEALLAL